MAKYHSQLAHDADRRAARLSAAAADQAPPPGRNKFGNEQVDTGTHKFPSKKEARRFEELFLLYTAGQIRELKLQPSFTLQESYITPAGERIRAIRYVADFSYIEGGRLVVEDVKSRATRTPTYLIKRKLMQERLGIEIKEI